MQRAPRALDNPALDVAVEVGNELGKPVVAFLAPLTNEPLGSMIVMNSTAATPTAMRDCLGLVGKHDRPWFERPVFGQIRYMSYASTSKKFDSHQYIRNVRQVEIGHV